MTTPTLREAAMAALPESVRFKLAAIAAECSDPGTTDALDELLESTALTAPEQSPADGGQETDEEEIDLTPPEVLASRLIDAWCASHGRPAPWATAVEISAVITKMDPAERQRLLDLDKEL